MPGEMDEIVLYPKKGKLLSAAAACLLLLGMAFFAALWPDEDKPGYILICAYFGILFFAICFLFIVCRLVVRKPSLIFNAEGLFENASLFAVGKIGWDEIKELFVYEYGKQKFLGIELKNPEIVLARVGLIKRLLLRSNSLFGLPLVSIPEAMLPLKIQLKNYPVKLRDQSLIE